MHDSGKAYVPAAGRDWLLPFYDPLTKLLGVEASHRRLLAQAAIRPGQRVLEIGCGTGNLTILCKRLNPGAEVAGIDPDPKALARARRKGERSKTGVQFDQGFAQNLPYPDASFDRVLSALMFHHLPPDVKTAALAQIRRVLKPGGSLHLVDFAQGGHPSGGLLRGHHHPGHATRFQHDVVALMQQAGFAEPREVAHQSVLIGRLAYYQAA